MRVWASESVTMPRWVAGAVVAWICAITGVAGWGYVRTEANIDAIAAEAEARTAAQCDAALASRAEDRDVLLRIAVEAGASDELVGIVERSYGDRPPPASCEDDP